MKEKMLIGAHVSFKKDTQLLGSLKDLISINGNSGGFYISDSRSYRKSYEIKDDEELISKFLENNDILLSNIVVHSPLVGNIASNDREKPTRELTIDSYYKDLKRMSKLGLKYLNFHPGSCPSYEEGISNISNGINELHERTDGDDTVVLIETMMKKGNYIGKKFEEVAEIISKVKNKSRVGVTIDTCHIWDAGYDLNNADKVLKEFDEVIGLKYLKAIHVNDSKNELGSNKDRHEQIGLGHIGLDNLKKFVNHQYIKDLPKVLETPYKEDNLKKWSEEIILLRN